MTVRVPVAAPEVVTSRLATASAPSCAVIVTEAAAVLGGVRVGVPVDCQ